MDNRNMQNKSFTTGTDDGDHKNEERDNEVADESKQTSSSNRSKKRGRAETDVVGSINPTSINFQNAPERQYEDMKQQTTPPFLRNIERQHIGAQNLANNQLISSNIDQERQNEGSGHINSRQQYLEQLQMQQLMNMLQPTALQQFAGAGPQLRTSHDTSTRENLGAINSTISLPLNLNAELLTRQQNLSPSNHQLSELQGMVQLLLTYLRQGQTSEEPQTQNLPHHHYQQQLQMQTQNDRTLVQQLQQILQENRLPSSSDQSQTQRPQAFSAAHQILQQQRDVYPGFPWSAQSPGPSNLLPQSDFENRGANTNAASRALLMQLLQPSSQPTPSQQFRSSQDAASDESRVLNNLLSQLANSRGPNTTNIPFPTATPPASLPREVLLQFLQQQQTNRVDIPEVQNRQNQNEQVSRNPRLESMLLSQLTGRQVGISQASNVASLQVGAGPPLPSFEEEGISLALPSDLNQLSEYQITVRNQLEFFVSKQEDVESNIQGRKKQVRLGQVGIRCRHCAMLPLRQRGRGAVYYPTKLCGVYQAAQNMATTHLSLSCSSMPIELRDKLRELHDRRDTASGGKQYWAETCQVIGLYEDEDGIRFRSSTNSLNNN